MLMWEVCAGPRLPGPASRTSDSGQREASGLRVSGLEMETICWLDFIKLQAGGSGSNFFKLIFVCCYNSILLSNIYLYKIKLKTFKLQSGGGGRL